MRDVPRGGVVAGLVWVWLRLCVLGVEWLDGGAEAVLRRVRAGVRGHLSGRAKAMLGAVVPFGVRGRGCTDESRERARGLRHPGCLRSGSHHGRAHRDRAGPPRLARRPYVEESSSTSSASIARSARNLGAGSYSRTAFPAGASGVAGADGPRGARRDPRRPAGVPPRCCSASAARTSTWSQARAVGSAGVSESVGGLHRQGDDHHRSGRWRLEVCRH